MEFNTYTKNSVPHLSIVGKYAEISLLYAESGVGRLKLLSPTQDSDIAEILIVGPRSIEKFIVTNKTINLPQEVLDFVITNTSSAEFIWNKPLKYSDFDISNYLYNSAYLWRDFLREK